MQTISLPNADKNYLKIQFNVTQKISIGKNLSQMTQYAYIFVLLHANKSE